MRFSFDVWPGPIRQGTVLKGVQYERGKSERIFSLRILISFITFI